MNNAPPYLINRVFKPRSLGSGEVVPIPLVFNISASKTHIYLPSSCCWAHYGLKGGMGSPTDFACAVCSARSFGNMTVVATQYYLTKDCRTELQASLTEHFLEAKASPVPVLENELMAENVARRVAEAVRKDRKEYEWNRTLAHIKQSRTNAVR